MKPLPAIGVLPLLALLAAFALADPAAAPPPAPSAKLAKVDFVKDVQPIFAATCYDCHGPTKQKAKLRLDSKELAMAGGNSGPCIIPGDSAKSYLVKRLLGQGDEDQMPAKHDPLSDAQIATLRAWIDQGANWPDSASTAGAKIERHWAYVKPVRPAVPTFTDPHDAAWARNPIDAFVLARLKKEGLAPSLEADRATLIRRVSLDLIGLPPSPAEVDAFVNDRSPDAYDKLVDRLLASPHYGERWARKWLDSAHYADTNGYEKDRTRSMWPYRDWVIHAINIDEPFDQFTIDQIAGDMLPTPTPWQRIATGFLRNTMLNEEGGIDVAEFRFKNIVDRVQTTSTTWLGMTMQCAQCHNHKYEPITQKEYYQFFGLLDNADEPTSFDVPSEETAKKREQAQQQIAKLESELEAHLPTGDEPIAWEVLKPTNFTATSGATAETLDDGSLLVRGPTSETDHYTVTADAAAGAIVAVRLEALTDPSLQHGGPGRLGGSHNGNHKPQDGNGNFVVSEFTMTASPKARQGPPAQQSSEPVSVPLTDARADFSQPQHPASAAIDGNPATGWAIDDGSGHLNVNRTATFHTASPVGFDAGTTLSFKIDQNYPDHSLGKFRLSVGRVAPSHAHSASGSTSESTNERRAWFLEEQLAEWEKFVAPKCAHWTVLDLKKFSRNYDGTITKLPDGSLLYTGDNFYRDLYKIELDAPIQGITGITALRLEVLPDDRLENGGPGRNPEGGFVLHEFTAAVASSGQAGDPRPPHPVEFQGATADFARDTVARAIDGIANTGWTIPKGNGLAHEAVFQLKEPLSIPAAAHLEVGLLQNYHQQENIGRLRLSATADKGPVVASGLPADVESILLTDAGARTAEQKDRIKRYFLSVTPLLVEQHKQIEALRQSMPKYPSALVMADRPFPRVTRVHHRGEFLETREAVEPNVPGCLSPMPSDAPRDRLALARWLVSDDNPLVGRVVMNRAWDTFFGRGIVATVGDLGVTGERPTHPELLDWLATEFPRQKWSMKAMHRLIVTSDTYRQTSRVTPDLLQRDPTNELLARGPRLRVEAEIVRDIALAAAGLLDERVGGPSVFPPQPDHVSEESYSATPWPTSHGPDRFRRGLYTFLKRTAPYPGMTTFDAPSSEVTCARRIRSNTPLQALTVLNDAVFMEAAQGMAVRVVTEGPKDPQGRARFAFRLCAAREPDPQEVAQLTAFYKARVLQFRADPAGAAQPVAVSEDVKPPVGEDLAEMAAWTTVSRAILNLDETITKE